MGLEINKDKIDVKHNGALTTIKVSDNRMYYKNKPDELKNDDLDKVNEYNQQYVADAAKFAKDEAKKIFKKNNGVETVVTKMPYMPKGSVDVTIHREKTRPIPGSDKKIVGPVVRISTRTQYKSVTKSLVAELQDDIKKSLA